MNLPKDKDAARRQAQQWFPDLALRLKRKKDEHRAESLLVAAYGRGREMTVKLDMTNEAYHFEPSLSASGAKKIALGSLAEFKYGEFKSNPAFDTGTATHTMVFEPHNAENIWCGPETRRGLDWKRKKLEADEAGALLLTEADYRLAADMAEAVRSNRAAADLLSGDLVCEASIFSKDPSTGVEMRCRPDGWRRDIGALIDLKTTIASDPEGFAKQCANLGYHIQDQFYRGAWRTPDLRSTAFAS
jgi:hypothetical protein